MTREEAINVLEQLMGIQIGHFTDAEMLTALDMAVDAIRWNPNWIPVEEKLPKHKVEDNGLITYEEVLVCLNDGYVTTDCYDDTRKKWLGYNGDVEYWMPTPQPPRKEE